MADAVSVAAGELTLLSPVSFLARPGGILAVCGSNGTGKTTLLRVLAGSLRPTAGRVTVGGALIDERQPAFRRAVAASVGGPPLARNLTLREHLVLVALSWGLSFHEADAAVDAVLGTLMIGRLSARFPHELSSGQSQLFAIALVVIRPSSVVVRVEPEQRLDRERLDVLIEVLAAYAESGKTVIAATHSSHLVERTGASVLDLRAPDAPAN